MLKESDKELKEKLHPKESEIIEPLPKDEVFLETGDDIKTIMHHEEDVGFEKAEEVQTLKKQEIVLETGEEIIFNFHQKTAPSSIPGAVFNILNATFGAGVLGLGIVFRETGLIMGAVYITIGAIVTLMSLLILQEAHELALLKNPLARSYSDIAYAAFEKNKYIKHILGNFIKLVIAIYGTFVGIGYIIIIADFLVAIWKAVTGNPDHILARKWLTSLIIIVPLFFVSLFNRMKDLRIFSYASISAITIFTGFLIVSLSSGFTNASKSGQIRYFNFSLSMVRVFGNIAFAFTSHRALPSINYDFQRSKSVRVKISLYFSTFIALVMYIVIGMISYLLFLDNTTGNTLASFKYDKDNWQNYLFSGIFCFALTLSYPMVLLPVKFSLDNILSLLWDWKKTSPEFHKSSFNLTWKDSIRAYFWKNVIEIRLFFWTLFICMIAYTVAVTFPNVEIVFSILGSSMASLCAFILPPILYLKLTSHKWLDIRCIGAVLIMCFGIFFAIFGTIITILKIAGAFSK